MYFIGIIGLSDVLSLIFTFGMKENFFRKKIKFHSEEIRIAFGCMFECNLLIVYFCIE